MRDSRRYTILLGIATADGPVSVDAVEDQIDQSFSDIAAAVEAAIANGHLTRDGTALSITRPGREWLREQSAAVRGLFEDPESLVLVGTVTSGLGKGKEFVALEGYERQFVDKLGYEPYPGTFNVSLSAPSRRKRNALEALEGTHVDGWEDGDRSFGPVRCYPTVVETADRKAAYETAHVIVPDRTEHDHTQLELLADSCLRRTFSLEDGDDIIVRVQPERIP